VRGERESGERGESERREKEREREREGGERIKMNTDTNINEKSR
jgi:hypothetical protein